MQPLPVLTVLSTTLGFIIIIAFLALPMAGALVLITALFLFLVMWFARGLRIVEGGDNPEIGVFMFFGKLKAICDPTLDHNKRWKSRTLYWIPPLGERLSRLTRISLIRESVHVPIHITTNDRVGIRFAATIDNVPLTDPESVTIGLTVTDDDVKNKLMPNTVKEAAYRAASRFSHEQILGFTVKLHRQEADEEKATEDTITPQEIEHAKQELENAIVRALEEKARTQWGKHIVDVHLSDFEPDEKAREAFEQEVIERAKERAGVTRTNKEIKQATLVDNARKNKGLDLNTFRAVSELDIERTAAEHGRQVELGLSRAVRQLRKEKE